MSPSRPGRWGAPGGAGAPASLPVTSGHWAGGAKALEASQGRTRVIRTCRDEPQAEERKQACWSSGGGELLLTLHENHGEGLRRPNHKVPWSWPMGKGWCMQGISLADLASEVDLGPCGMWGLLAQVGKQHSPATWKAGQRGAPEPRESLPSLPGPKPPMSIPSLEPTATCLPLT